MAGKETSVWIDTTPETDFAPLEAGRKVDAVVIGGGIAGLLSAWLLQEAGLEVAVVEKERIVTNTTGNTTAKLTSQHYLIYDFLIREHGGKTARLYAEANQQGIDRIEQLAQRQGIDCDFDRRSAYVYTERAEVVSEIQAEVRAAQSLGLPASFEKETDLPFSVKAAVKFDRQAHFHPRKFLLGIAKAFVERGGRIYEQTEATGIVPGSPHRVETKKGRLESTYVVEATKYPFWRPELFEDAMWRKLSYALGIRLKAGSSYPQGMYINHDEPLRSIRSHPYEDGELLIFGGDSHDQKDEYDKDQHWRSLLADAKQKFAVEELLYRWVAGDTMPHDRLPYIGPYPKHPTIFIATGFRAWGLAWAAAAATFIKDSVASHPRAEWPFGLERLNVSQKK